MLLMAFAFLLAIAAGVVTGGLAGSAWTMATGERPGLYLLTERSLATPIKVAVLVFNAPLLLAANGYAALDNKPMFGLLALFASGLWCFVQGVFILTQVFGVT